MGRYGKSRSGTARSAATPSTPEGCGNPAAHEPVMTQADGMGTTGQAWGHAASVLGISHTPYPATYGPGSYEPAANPWKSDEALG